MVGENEMRPNNDGQRIRRVKELLGRFISFATMPAKALTEE